ncbi:RES domain-containing protein [Segatella bryantii]|uniref:RES domain-containing protein n=1 Tax=Segatella bryantii TaxID=77095 RepID=A0ABX4ELD8_SEGBR|nr:RES domain-containing protein [Segatella bryantii]OYP57130.1 hypothetical protein CIK91_00825 [Segatella bryantii]UKK82239.1 RES domain-containing protein [Segatella bryantii]
MRTTDKYAIFSREDMFNIPFDLLELQNYARFNALGYSCLYLANSLYISWEEMRRPDISKVNFAHFKNQKQMNLLDLTIPLKITKRKDLLTIFLTLLCTVEVSNDEKSYKYEYVIPNLVIGSLISAYFDSSRLSLDGIRYISSKRFESEKLEFDNQTQLIYDYVFPALDYEQKGHCNHLKHLFKLSKGRSLFLYNAHQICFRKKTTFTTNYKDSLFYELENYVKKEKLDFIRE